jgi:dihydrofolate reductase
VSATVLYMSMSLDGFVAGPNESPDNGLGDGGDRLHEWFSAGAATGHGGVPGRPEGINGEMMDEAMATGAVVAGRGTFEPAGGWGGDHHDGVPIFILSRHQPDAEVAQWPLVTYVSDVETAMTRAKDAAGEKDVLVHGVGTARLALAAGVLDELQIHLIPVLFGGRPATLRGARSRAHRAGAHPGPRRRVWNHAPALPGSALTRG